jgi:hypothetical protein
MLETVRQYAQERLGESGEGGVIRGRHLRYCVALAEKNEPGYFDARQGQAIALQRAEQENLLAAHAWCEHDPEGAALGLRLAAASWFYWRASAQLERGRDLARAALAHAGADAAPLPRCRLINGLANMCRDDESKALAEQGLAIAREIGDLPQIAAASVLLAYYPEPDEDPRRIMARYDEIRSIALALGDSFLLGRNLNNLAEWHRNQGHGAEAAASYEESLAILRKLKHPGMITAVLCNHARLLLGLGEEARARANLDEAFAVVSAHGLPGMHEHLLEVGAALAARRADPERAARLHGASLARLREGGAERESLDEAFLAPLMASARAALGAAAFDAAEHAGAALKREAALDELGAWLAGPRDDL